MLSYFSFLFFAKIATVCFAFMIACSAYLTFKHTFTGDDAAFEHSRAKPMETGFVVFFLIILFFLVGLIKGYAV